MSDKYVSTIELLGEKLNIKDSRLWEMLNVASGSNMLTVGKNGAEFKSISDAIKRALYLGVSNDNPICIFIYAGVYNEQIILNNIHGLSFIGCGIDKTTIRYNGSYPDCVVHVQGDVSFYNLSINNTNGNTYAVHCDPVDSMVSGKLSFTNCRLYGGSSAVGYGSGQGVTLELNDCTLEGNDSIVYAHNSSYARTNQVLIVNNCLFRHTTETFCVLLDDAGYTNGGTVSPMRVIFSNNTFSESRYGRIRFRKTTAIESTWVSYLPVNDSNIMCGPGCSGNNGIPGLNFYVGKIDISQYITLPTNPDTSGNYVVSIFIPVDGNNYFATINDITLPGVGSVTANFSVVTRSLYCLTISTSDSNYAGRSLAASITLTCL